MPRNGAGTYSRAGSAYVYNTVIDQVAVNAEMDDIATALTASISKDGQTTPTANLPMGGYKLTGLGAGAAAGNSLRYEQLFTTGAVQLLGALDLVKGADIASATTVNLTTATGNGVHITGTTQIDAVTLGSGMLRIVVFDGILTLAHHATNNNLPGGANITTAAGDRAIYWADGTTVYCIAYLPAAGNLPKTGGSMTGDITMSGASIVETEGAAVASATSCDIWATDGNTVHITGTTGITDFATAPQAGAWMKLIFDDAVTLTQSTNLNVNGGGANVTTAAGDMALVYADTTTQMDVFVIRKSGASVVASTPVFTASYDSGNQTISSGGTLSLTHSLGAKPKAVQFYAKCLTAEYNYSIGDEVQLAGPGVVFVGAGSSTNGGFVSASDTTTIFIRFASGTTNPIAALDKTTGALATLTNASWAFIVRAYA